MSAAGRYMSGISHLGCLLLNSEVRFRPGKARITSTAGLMSARDRPEDAGGLKRWPRRGWPLAGYPAELSITNSTNFAIFSRVRSPEFEM
jgi:hypothetical protein